MRGILPALVAMTALVACAEKPGLQSGATPVDLAAASAAFYRENPGMVAALLNDREKGFEIYEDGKAFFVPWNAISDLRVRTGVSSMQGSEICFREQGGWGGICLNVYQNPDGTFFVEDAAGKLPAFSQTLRLRPIDPQ